MSQTELLVFLAFVSIVSVMVLGMLILGSVLGWLFWTSHKDLVQWIKECRMDLAQQIWESRREARRKQIENEAYFKSLGIQSSMILERIDHPEE